MKAPLVAWSRVNVPPQIGSTATVDVEKFEPLHSGSMVAATQMVVFERSLVGVPEMASALAEAVEATVGTIERQNKPASTWQPPQMTVPVSPTTVPLSACAAMATPDALASVTLASVHVVVLSAA